MRRRNGNRRQPNSRRRGRGRRRSQFMSPLSWLSPASENKVTSIVLQGESVLATSAGGNAFFSIPFDPSAAGYNFAEWSGYQSLYNEIKFVACRIQLCASNHATITQGSPLFIGWRFDTNAAPTATAQVTQLASTVSWNIQNETSSRGFQMTARSQGALNWSPTSTVVTNSYAGCPGSFQMAGFSFAASINIAIVRVRSIYLVRGRA